MKVRISDGKKGKKFLHDLKHPVTTTSDFGFVQPLMAREVNANDNISLSIPQFVRLGVVNKPVFGRMHVKTYNYFVPIETIFHPWGSLQAQQSYSHGGESYIPQSVWSMYLSHLNILTKLESEICMFAISGLDKTNSGIRFDGLFSAGDVLTFDTFNNKLKIWLISSGIASLSAVSEIVDFVRDTSDGNEICSDITANYAQYWDPVNGIDDLAYFDWFDVIHITVAGVDHDILIAGRFKRCGKNLRKILIGCGYQLAPVPDVKSLLPLMAYYKAYFDIFQPDRDITWKDSNLYKVCERCEYAGYDNFSAAIGMYDPDDTTFPNFDLASFMTWFFVELPQCYHTSNPDYVSSHITGASLPIVDGHDSNSFDYLDSENSIGSVYQYNGNGSGQAVVDEISSTGLTRSALRILDKLSMRINAHTAIGGRIREYLRMVFGAKYKEQDPTFLIGTQSWPLEVSDVFSTAETSEEYLGAYAGKGVGYINEDSAQKMSYTAESSGFVVSLLTIVPDVYYSQAVDPLVSHIHRRDFYDPEFDGITLLPNKRHHIFAAYDLAGFNDITRINGSFGNIPNYSEYKIAYSVLNGDVSRRSTRDSLSPYVLDKLLPWTRCRKLASDFYTLDNVNPNLIVNGTLWRYTGRDRWLGNYDRIFRDSGKTPDPLLFDTSFFRETDATNDDNFIVHNFILLKINGFELPMKDSFDTGAFDSDFEVEHA